MKKYLANPQNPPTRTTGKCVGFEKIKRRERQNGEPGHEIFGLPVREGDGRRMKNFATTFCRLPEN
jgi:hypothetical protein